MLQEAGRGTAEYGRHAGGEEVSGIQELGFDSPSNFSGRDVIVMIQSSVTKGTPRFRAASKRVRMEDPTGL